MKSNLPWGYCHRQFHSRGTLARIMAAKVLFCGMVQRQTMHGSGVFIRGNAGEQGCVANELGRAATVALVAMVIM
jgi:hypothetical protein